MLRPWFNLGCFVAQPLLLALFCIHTRAASLGINLRIGVNFSLTYPLLIREAFVYLASGRSVVPASKATRKESLSSSIVIAEETGVNN